jgi:hypothetical protein
MTFGHLAAHIVSGNYFFCSNVGDVPRPKMEELKETEGKDKLVAALKASFEFCDSALAKADDSKLNENITWSDGKPRARGFGLCDIGQQLGGPLRDGGHVSPSKRTHPAYRETGRKEVTFLRTAAVGAVTQSDGRAFVGVLIRRTNR